MNWLCFGLGFSCGIFGWFCMCLLVFRGLKESRSQAHEDMKILHGYWESANDLAFDRNELLRGAAK